MSDRTGHADFCNKDHAPGTTPCARIVPAEPRVQDEHGEPLTAVELAALPEDSRVVDATGDIWRKVDGFWVCQDARCRGESLLHVWGPITLLEEAA